MSLLVRDALFEQGLDIRKPDVLGAIAATEGIASTPPRPHGSWCTTTKKARRRGVRGSPEFFLDGHGWYCPSLHIENVDGALRIEPDIEAIEAFLTACFE